MIAGTSMGSLIGGLYIGGVSTDALEAKFCDRSLMKSFNSIPPYVRIFAFPYRTVKRTMGLKSFDGLYKGNVFRKFMHKEWPVSDGNIEDLPRPFAALAFNLLDGNTYAIRRGNLGTALEASCAIPVLRKPIEIGNKLFVDGGSVDNVPVDEARALGGDIVIAVNVDESVKQLPADYFYRVGSVAPRMINLELAIADARHCKNADIIIHPNVDGIGITSTSREEAKRAIKAGERAAEEAMPAIKEKLQSLGVVLETAAQTEN
jgi:NTE family protein